MKWKILIQHYGSNFNSNEKCETTVGSTKPLECVLQLRTNYAKVILRGNMQLGNVRN